MPQRETSAVHRFIKNLLCGGARRRIRGRAHPSLGRCLAVRHRPQSHIRQFLGALERRWSRIVISWNHGMSWHIMAPRISLHAFFFLLCRWKAEGCMGCRMTDDGCCCKTLHGHMLNLGVGVSWCLHRHTGWLPGYSAFSRRLTSARRLLRSGVEVGTSRQGQEPSHIACRPRWISRSSDGFKTPWPPCQVVPLPPKPQFGHWVWQQSTSRGWEAQGSTSTSTADVVSSASYRSSRSILSLEITDEILCQVLWHNLPLGLHFPASALRIPRARHGDMLSYFNVAFCSLFLSHSTVWIVQIHFIIPSFRVSGDGTDADEEAHHLCPATRSTRGFLRWMTSDDQWQVGEVQLLQCPVSEPLGKYLEANGWKWTSGQKSAQSNMLEP